MGEGDCATPSCRFHGFTVDPQPACRPPGVKDLEAAYPKCPGVDNTRVLMMPRFRSHVGVNDLKDKCTHQ